MLVSDTLTNAIVFSLTSSEPLYAIELGWIREVFTLSHVTPVPHAPPAIAGVVNFSGSILSIIDLRTLDGHPARATQGESALLVEVDRCQAALRVGTIDEVSSLARAPRTHCLYDSRHRKVTLLDPSELFRIAKQARSPIAPVSNEE